MRSIALNHYIYIFNMKILLFCLRISSLSLIYIGLILSGCAINYNKLVSANCSEQNSDTILVFRNSFKYLDSNMINNCVIKKNYLKESLSPNSCVDEFDSLRNRSRTGNTYVKLFTKGGKIIEEGYLLCLGCEFTFHSGTYKAYHPNGRLFIIGSYDHSGNKEGIWSFFDQEDRIRSKGQYSQDRKTGTWFFYDKFGNIYKQSKYPED
jgi:hypothetical protein